MKRHTLSPPAQWLGRRLREQRESAGLTLQQAGSYIHRDASTVSRMESGRVPPRMPDVVALMDRYGVSDDGMRLGLEQLCGELRRAGERDGCQRYECTRATESAWLESTAVSICRFEFGFVPGLLQTAEYARARSAVAQFTASEPGGLRSVGRVVGDHEYPRAGRPPLVLAVMDEAVLHRVVGSRTVLGRQLEHLLVLSTLPHIDLRIVPFSSACDRPQAPFRVLTMPYPYPDLAVIDTPTGPLQIEGSGCDQMSQAFAVLSRSAASADDSRALIRAELTDAERCDVGRW